MNHREARKERKKLGLTQTYVARKIGVTQAAVSQFERYGVPMSPAKERQLFRLLNKSAEGK